TGARHDADAPLPNWLNIDCQVLSGELQMRWTFSDQVYRPDTVRSLAESYRQELRAIIDHCVSETVGGMTPSDFPLVRLDQSQLDALPVPARAIEDIYPLTPMQEGLLLHTLLEPGTGIYFMQDRYSIDSELEVERFDRAWRMVVARHEALRASFCWDAGGAMVQIIHRDVMEGVQFLDWSTLPASQHESQLQALLQAERAAGFDLLERPPLRLRLIRLAPERHWFIMSNHHILIDAWCRSLLMGDFLEIYRALGEGTEPVLTAPPRYREFIAWLSSRSRTTSRDWWRTALAGFERPTFIPSDRPVQQNSAGQHGSVQKGSMRVGDRYAWLQPAQSARLRELAQRHQLTVNTFAQAAWALVLRRYSGERDVVFGVTVAGRPAELPQMQRAVGLFINTVPLRVPMPGAGQRCSVREWLSNLLDRNLALREHEHVPLVEIQECSELPKGRPLFDSLFVFENAPVEHSVLDRAQGLNARSGSGRTHTNYPLTVVCYPGDTLGLHLSYDQRFFAASTVDRLLADFDRLLLALLDHFDRDFSELPLLAAGERRLQLEDWNHTQVEYPLDAGYASLFDARVAADPRRVVARCMGEAWTYAELDS
ncbi:MAG TPA: condensation domain-containing protein, partial [Steroidobacter sp.]|nr:condensation domain-containing protein [Steroidobacter sp.]